MAGKPAAQAESVQVVPVTGGDLKRDTFRNTTYDDCKLRDALCVAENATFDTLRTALYTNEHRKML